MIKKMIGIVVALAAIAVIVIATMHSDRFSSLVFDEGEPAVAVEAASDAAANETPEVVVPDTLGAGPAVADSMAIAHPDSVHRHPDVHP